MEKRIDDQKILLQEKRERADEVLNEYHDAQAECKDNLDEMWSKCNQCITQKCVQYYADNCEVALKSAIEEDEIIPPCRQKPTSPCNNQGNNQPDQPDNNQSVDTPLTKSVPSIPDDTSDNSDNSPKVSGSMQIIVNGKPVSSMEDALESIKEQMQQTVTPPCEPGSKFEQFSQLVSMQRID